MLFIATATGYVRGAGHAPKGASQSPFGNPCSSGVKAFSTSHKCKARYPSNAHPTASDGNRHPYLFSGFAVTYARRLLHRSMKTKANGYKLNLALQEKAERKQCSSQRLGFLIASSLTYTAFSYPAKPIEYP